MEGEPLEFGFMEEEHKAQEASKSNNPGKLENLNTYQRYASTTAIYPSIGQLNVCESNRNPYYPALGLAGEVGEFCNKLKKVMRDNKGVITPEFIKDAESELGDILWYLAACATELGLELGTIAEANLGKLFKRKEKGTLKGSGDER